MGPLNIFSKTTILSVLLNYTRFLCKLEGEQSEVGILTAGVHGNEHMTRYGIPIMQKRVIVINNR